MKVHRLVVRRMRRAVSDVVEDAAHLAAAPVGGLPSYQRDVLLEIARGMGALRSALRSARRWHRLGDRGAAAVWVHFLVSKDALVMAAKGLISHGRPRKAAQRAAVDRLEALVLSAEAAHDEAVDRFRMARSVWRNVPGGSGS